VSSSAISARQTSDEMTSVGLKRARANVVFPAPAGPTRISSASSGISIRTNVQPISTAVTATRRSPEGDQGRAWPVVDARRGAPVELGGATPPPVAEPAPY